MSLRIAAAAVAVNVAMISAAVALDAKLPSYQTAPDISGQIKSVGSDTLANAMVLWAKGFMDKYPAVKIDVESEGSATAPPALGITNLVN
jgi:phosphate transport system substrate-binding protein